MVSNANFIIFSDSGTFYAKNGTTGSIDFSNANISALTITVQNALPSNGGKVVFATGFYNVDSSVNLNKPDSIFSGMGNGTRFYSDDPILIINVSDTHDVVVRDMAIEGNGNPVDQTGITVRSAYRVSIINVRTENMGYDGIQPCGPVWDILVQGCWVNLCGDDGINPGADQAHNVRIIGNSVTNVTHDGIHISYHTQNSTIMGNTIFQCGNGIGLFAASYNTITENVIKNCLQGISTRFPGSNGNIIADNIIVGSTAAAPMNRGEDWYFGASIFLADSYYNKVIGNTVLNGANVDIHLNDTVYDTSIIGNTIINSATYAIENLATRSLINGNNIQNAGISAIRELGFRTLVSGNMIDEPATALYSITLGNANMYRTIMGNTIFGGILGIRLGANVDDTFIQNNVVLGQTTTSIEEGAGCNNNVINGNTVDHGITVVGANTIVSHNTGFTTENRGVATATGAVNTVTVNHGLAAAAEIVLVQCNNTGAGNWTVTSISATQFVITFPYQPATSIWAFYWYVDVYN
jgi:parallel beta-helix repeat protein